MGEVSSGNLVEAIDKSRKRPLYRFVFALGVPGVGETIAKDLANCFGSIERIRTALSLTLRYVPGIGEDIADAVHGFFSQELNTRIIDDLLKELSIDEGTDRRVQLAERPTLGTLLLHLNILKVGKKTAELAAESFDSIRAIADADKSVLERVLKSADAANEINSFFSDLVVRRKAEAAEQQFMDFGIHWSQREVEQSHEAPLPLSGKSFVLTGTLESMHRDAAREEVEALGGRVTSSVSAKTDYVVVGVNPGSKLADATRLGIRTLTEADFRELIIQAKKSQT
jgi:DNA ligase (NAD+)